MLACLLACLLACACGPRLTRVWKWLGVPQKTKAALELKLAAAQAVKTYSTRQDALRAGMGASKLVRWAVPRTAVG